MFSDECYAEFTWDGPPRSVLESGNEGVVAVHSLSKRSNLAGVRAGFYAGDPELVTYLLDVRRHAGLMVPGPVQAGAVVALDDDVHVDEQRARYLDRLEFLADALALAGLPVAVPAGGFYLWLPVPGRGSPTAGRCATSWPTRPGCWSARGSSTARTAAATCGWPWSSPGTDSSWWRSASAPSGEDRCARRHRRRRRGRRVGPGGR